jgi:hypothetical protein
MSGTGTEGNTQASRSLPLSTSYMPNGDPGPYGGGTYTNYPTEPSLRDYENVFGPSARDIKDDLQKYKRHGRWHLPDILKGPNPWLTDRIDGLITDATNSPFTSIILPYRYHDNVDGKIKWNVWSFDEAMASRVPYEAAARTLTQSKRSFAGYAVRHGLAINLEHNFMMTPHGRENFQNQLKQLIGSIQYSNDLDVHMALILAPSYEKTMSEKYFGQSKTSSQVCREFVDLFGFMQKNQNALDILIEESKIRLKTWGGPMPDFLLCNSKLGFQLQMVPERTNYLTQGPDGVKRLKQGPDLQSYRGLKIVHTRAFSLETGLEPRDMLRRRVRVAEYYRIAPSEHNYKREFEFYNEARDNWFSLTFAELLNMARVRKVLPNLDLPGDDNSRLIDEFLEIYSMPMEAGGEARRGHMATMGARVSTQGSRRGQQLRAPLRGSGSGRRGARRSASRLGVDPSDFHKRQAINMLWRRMYEEFDIVLKNPSVDAVANCSVNRKPYGLVLDEHTGVIFTSSSATGIFNFGVSCEILEKLVKKELAGGLEKIVLNRAKIWPPFKGWNLLKRHLNLEDQADILRDEHIFHTKRCFFRYGFKVPEQPWMDKCILEPFGAYDEPNNSQHFVEGLRETGTKNIGKYLHRQLLLTTDVINILMSRTEDGRTLIDAGASTVVPDMINILRDVVEGEEKAGGFSLHVSLKFSERFCKKYESSVPDFCTRELLWTFPDSSQMACFSHGNICGGFQEDAGFYEEILQTKGVERYLLSQNFLNALLEKYSGLPPEKQELFRQKEPAFFVRAKSLVTHRERSFLEDMVTGFAQVLYDRLFSDAYENPVNSEEYYKSFKGQLKTVIRFCEADKSAKILPVKASPYVLSANSTVRSRALSFTEEMHGSAFFRVFDDNSDSASSFDPSEFDGREDGEDGEDGRGDRGPEGGDDVGPPDPAPGDGDDDDERDGLLDDSEEPRPRPGAPRPRPPPIIPAPPPGRDDYSEEEELRDRLRQLEYENDRLRRDHGGPRPDPPGPDGRGDPKENTLRTLSKHIEIVILRPNIEHYMLGIIMGLAGEQLGNTLWGQTELSVYDDSMHGVWGMSYK